MPNPRGMRWHPLMIRWCLYLRHKSVITIHNYHTIHVYDAQLPGAAYDALRTSGCIRLPSQRTLRDYTHYIKSSSGFSTDVDKMLMDAARITTCPEREKYVILLLDEMHVRDDLGMISTLEK